MTKLKTLKDIGNQETLFYHSRNKEIIFMGNPDEKNIKKYDGKRFVLVEDLRVEAIKWLNYYQSGFRNCFGKKHVSTDELQHLNQSHAIIQFITQFFNLIEGGKPK